MYEVPNGVAGTDEAIGTLPGRPLTSITQGSKAPTTNVVGQLSSEACTSRLPGAFLREFAARSIDLQFAIDPNRILFSNSYIRRLPLPTLTCVVDVRASTP